MKSPSGERSSRTATRSPEAGTEQDMGRLDGKTAVVTGAAGGIGKEIASAFAREGARVGMLDNNAALLEQAVAAVPGASALPCDVADRAAVRDRKSTRLNSSY